MKITFVKKASIIRLLCLGILGIILLNSCVESKLIADKSGMQLWSENCSRCHNASSSNSFSKEEWKTVGMHMQSRAILTNSERDKIIEFLQN